MCAWMKMLPDNKQLENEGFVKTLKKIEGRLDSLGNGKKLKEKPFFTPEYKTPDKSEYLQDLREQMLEKSARHQQENKKRTEEWINNDYSPFPNRGITPKQVKREREQKKMIIMKKGLDFQMIEKNTHNREMKENDHKKISSLIQEDLKMFQKNEDRKREAKIKEKNLLVESWSQAVAYKHGESVVNPSGLMSPSDDTKRTSFFGKELREKEKKGILDQRIEDIIAMARQSHFIGKISPIAMSTNQIIKGGRKHFH